MNKIVLKENKETKFPLVVENKKLSNGFTEIVCENPDLLTVRDIYEMVVRRHPGMTVELCTKIMDYIDDPIIYAENGHGIPDLVVNNIIPIDGFVAVVKDFIDTFNPSALPSFPTYFWSNDLLCFITTKYPHLIPCIPTHIINKSSSMSMEDRLDMYALELAIEEKTKIDSNRK